MGVTPLIELRHSYVGGQKFFHKTFEHLHHRDAEIAETPQRGRGGRPSDTFYVLPQRSLRRGERWCNIGSDICEKHCGYLHSILLEGADCVRIRIVEAIEVRNVAGVGGDGWRHVLFPHDSNLVAFARQRLVLHDEGGLRHFILRCCLERRSGKEMLPHPSSPKNRACASSTHTAQASSLD